MNLKMKGVCTVGLRDLYDDNGETEKLEDTAK